MCCKKLANERCAVFVRYIPLVLIVCMICLNISIYSKLIHQPCISGRKQVVSEKIKQLNFTYQLDPSHVCKDKQNLLVAVITAPKNKLKRQKWREFFQTHSKMENVTYRHVFVIGQISELDDTSQRSILAEHGKYSDILQEDFRDIYENLAIKSFAMLKWFVSNCGKVDYVLKIDDDVFLNLPGLWKAIYNASSMANRNNQGQNATDFVLGHYEKSHHPIRNPKSKWYVSTDLYSKPRYPDYSNGAAYVISRGAAERMYQACRLERVIPLEDMFITGYCRDKAGVKIVFNDNLCMIRELSGYIPDNCVTLHTYGKRPDSYAPRNSTTFT